MSRYCCRKTKGFKDLSTSGLSKDEVVRIVKSSIPLKFKNNSLKVRDGGETSAC